MRDGLTLIGMKEVFSMNLEMKEARMGGNMGRFTGRSVWRMKKYQLITCIFWVKWGTGLSTECPG